MVNPHATSNIEYNNSTPLLNSNSDYLMSFVTCIAFSEMSKEDNMTMFGAGCDSGMLSVDPVMEVPSDLGSTAVQPITEESNVENPLLGLQGKT